MTKKRTRLNNSPYALSRKWTCNFCNLFSFRQNSFGVSIDDIVNNASLQGFSGRESVTFKGNFPVQIRVRDFCPQQSGK